MIWRERSSHRPVQQETYQVSGELVSEMLQISSPRTLGVVEGGRFAFKKAVRVGELVAPEVQW